MPEQTDGNQTSSGDGTEQRVGLTKTYSEEERFELLSAYLDDEVTAEERRQVAQWLMDDPHTLQMYRRLLMLRQAIRTAPIQAQPPLQVPTPPPQSWGPLSSSTMRRTVIFAVAIALLSGLSQLSTTSGRQQLQEAWQYIKALPEGTLLDIGFTAMDLSTDTDSGPISDSNHTTR
ncbi:MAG: zf-HC2 domain-containing protein [Cyanobacteria bacterium J06607_17]